MLKWGNLALETRATRRLLIWFRPCHPNVTNSSWCYHSCTYYLFIWHWHSTWEVFVLRFPHTSLLWFWPWSLLHGKAAKQDAPWDGPGPRGLNLAWNIELFKWLPVKQTKTKKRNEKKLVTRSVTSTSRLFSCFDARRSWKESEIIRCLFIYFLLMAKCKRLMMHANGNWYIHEVITIHIGRTQIGLE